MTSANDSHQFTALFGLAPGLFHGLLLLGDHGIGFSLVQEIVPFAASSYRPVWVGLRQITFYLWLAIAFSFYVRKRIGQKTWRVLHYVSLLTFALALVHGIFSGTDTPWAGCR